MTASLTMDAVAELVAADARVVKVGAALAKAGYRYHRSRVRLNRRGNLVVRIVWRLKADGLSSSFTGAFHYAQADLDRALRHHEAVKARGWL